MKKVSIFMLALCVSFMVSAQNIIERHFNHFAEQENITSVHVSGKMFEIIDKIDIETDDEEFNQIQDMMGSIESFHLIAVPELTDPRAAYNDGIKKLEPRFEQLVNVRDKENSFSLYVDEEGDIVRELVGIGAADEKFVVFSLIGSIDLNEIGELIGKIRSKGFDKVNEVVDIGLEEVKVYPNPVARNSQVNLDVPEMMIGGAVSLFDMNGNLLKTSSIDNQNQTISTSGLTNGYYIIEVKKEDVVVKKRVAVIQ